MFVRRRGRITSGRVGLSRRPGRRRHLDRIKWLSRLAGGLGSFSRLGFLRSSLRAQIPELGGGLLLSYLLDLAEWLQFNVVNFRQRGERRPIRDLGELRRVARRVLHGFGLLYQGPGRTDSRIFAPGGVECLQITGPIGSGSIVPLIVAERRIGHATVMMLVPGHEA